jgi:hypothetical protein
MKKIIPNLALILCFTTGYSRSAFATPPALSGTLSLVPGLGQISNGDFLEGLGWFATTIGGLIATQGNANNQTIFLDLWMYNMYDAYRDAGASRTAKHNVFQNYIAAYNPTLLWGPYSTAPLGTQSLLVANRGRPKFALGPNNRVLSPLYMSFVALGEEALFRGFIFSGFMNLTNGSLQFSSISSSLLFAAAHSLYSGQRSSAFHPYTFAFRTLLGYFYCLQTNKDAYDLRKSIFSHTWVDVLYEWDRLGTFGGGGQIGQLRHQASSTSILKPQSISLKYSYEF